MRSFNFKPEYRGDGAPRVVEISLDEEPSTVHLTFSKDVLLLAGGLDGVEVESNTTNYPDEDEGYPSTVLRVDGAPFLILGAMQVNSNTIKLRLGFP